MPVKKVTLVEQLLEQFPNLENRTAARHLAEIYPEHFPSVERARNAVRFVRGAIGKYSRTAREHASEFFKEPGKAGERRGLPLPTEPEDYAPYTLDPGRTAIISDIHVPHHDMEAVETCLGYLEKIQPDHIVINGDGIDFSGISRFVTPLTARKTRTDAEAYRQFLEHLRDTFPNTRIIHKDGNHEKRWYRFLLDSAREIADFDELQLDSVLKFDDYGIEYVHDQQPVQVGKLLAFHGHERPQGITAPVNPARGLFLWAKGNVIAGHYHQTSEHSERDIMGGHIGCWSVGCLCRLQPEYSPWNLKHNHGFAVVEHAGDGSFTVQNHRIINGVLR